VENFAQQVINGPSLFCIRRKTPGFCTHRLQIGTVKQAAFATRRKTPGFAPLSAISTRNEKRNTVHTNTL
jgi:hypothetical protein